MERAGAPWTGAGLTGRREPFASPAQMSQSDWRRRPAARSLCAHPYLAREASAGWVLLR